MQGKGSSSFNMLPLAWVGIPLGGLIPDSNSRGNKDEDILSEEGSGVTGSHGKYWACQFFDSELACDCLLKFSGMF